MISQMFFDLSNYDNREQIEAFIQILNKNNSLGAKSHRSLKLFAHLLASAETSQECLLALLNVKATIRSGSMRDKFMNIGFHLLERASRLLNYNKVKNGAKVFSFASETPRILTSNSSRIHFQFTIFLTNSLSIHFFFRESTSNSLSISRIHFQFTIFFATSLSIHTLFREFTSNSLSFLRIHFELPFDFANSLSIHYLFREIV